MSSRSIANRLESARLALTNAMAETELRSALAPFGYDEARLQQGKGLYESALAVWQSQQQKQSRRRAAVAAYDRADAAASRAYVRGVKLCRTLYRDDSVTYRTLGLAGSRRRSFASKVAQMRLFYSAARRFCPFWPATASQKANCRPILPWWLRWSLPAPSARWRAVKCWALRATASKRSPSWTAGWGTLLRLRTWPWKRPRNGWRCWAWPGD
jgi:hypothetical protein